MTRISRPRGDSFSRLFETTGCWGHEKPSIKKKKKMDEDGWCIRSHSIAYPGAHPALGLEE